MPSAFPSHQGLILPIVRLWPRAIRVLPLCVGAAIPDVIDGVDGIVRRGHLGQGWAHTLIGAALLCVPIGLMATWLLATIDRRWRRSGRLRRVRRFFTIAGDWASDRPTSAQTLAAPAPAESAPTSLAIAAFSVLVGAVSHVFFDCISHENCRWLAPWRDDSHCFPAWWYEPWFAVHLPGYREPYPFAPHTVMWCALTLLGAMLYFWPALPRRRNANPTKR